MSDTSDTDDFLSSLPTPPPKKFRAGESSSKVDIKEEFRALRQDMQYLHKIGKDLKVPAALQRKLSETFKCNICQHSPISPPVIFARCCKSVVGCQTCVDQWYRGEDGISKKCPLCGTDRALPETMRLHGLDDFLVSIAPLLGDPQMVPEDAEV